MASLGACIGEIFARLRLEFPVITIRMQSQFQHSECVGITDLAIRCNNCQRCVVCAARSHYELADTIHCISLPGRVLRSETLINMVVTVQDHIGMAGVQELPEGQ